MIRYKRALKRLIFAFGLALSVLSLKAQTYVTAPMTGTPVAGSYYSNSSIILNPTFSFTAAAGSSLNLYIVNPDCVPQNIAPSTGQNYIITSVPRNGGFINAGTGINTGDFANRTTCDLMQTIQYFDGLGRPLQTVQVKASPLDKDIVQPFAYDAYGREAVKYLSYTSPTADGSYKTAAIISEIGSFYYPAGSTAASGAQQSNGIVYNPVPNSTINFELSPLDRVVEQGAPGHDWQPGAGHTMKTVYTYNNNNNTFSGADTAVSMLVVLYSATVNGDLTRTLARGNYYQPGQLFVTVSKDENWKSGRGGIIEEYKDNEGHVVLKRTYNFTGGALQQLSTYYVYDDLGKLAFVLPPKSNADNILPDQTTLDNLCYQYRYDERSRLNKKKLPGKGWEFIIYNKQDQVVANQDAMQRGKALQEWTVTRYDALGRPVTTGIYKYGPTANQDYSADVKSQAENATFSIAETYTGNAANYGYSNSSFPVSIDQVLSVNYYDTYGFAGTNPYPYSSGSSKTMGLPTGSLTNVLGSTTMLWKVQYYDNKGRVVEAFQQHYLGGVQSVYNYDELSNSYNDITNEVTVSKRELYTKNANNTDKVKGVTIINSYAYDHMGRKTQTQQQINSGANIVLSKLGYNEIGQLKSKGLHSENGGTSFLQTVNYRYNERGWLQSSQAGLFSENLYYNQPTDNSFTSQYNGNISEMTYTKSGTSNVVFKYGYDQLNRLLSGASTGGSTMGELLTYDQMGNISTLTRTGSNPVNLAYAYYNSNASNQLQTVTNSGAAFRSYAYDSNGNATGDGGSKTIAYNLLDLPQTVTQSGTTQASYIYDCTGRKLSNTGSDGRWDYVSGIVYNGTSIATEAISFIQTEEGRAVSNGSSWNYTYNLTDHLGNVRLSFDKDPSSGMARRIQEDEYYAFGLRTPGGYNFSNGNRYLYNGKEVQTDLTNQYDYGARFYDAMIARWTRIDNKSEAFENISPYVYAVNDPVNAVDPDGNLIIFVNGFVPGHWWGKNLIATVPVYDRPFHPKYVPNPDYRPYPGDRNFASGAPHYLGKAFDYWGNIDDAFKQGYQDNHALYVNASSDNTSEAKDRYAEGETAGRNLMKKLDDGSIVLKDGETIKIVGHSQGGAFAAGMAAVLSKSKKYASVLQEVVYLEPHQPADFSHPSKIPGVQISSPDDRVASRWNIFKGWKGKTSYASIRGVSIFIPNDTHDDDDGFTGLWGHSVGTNLDEIVAYFHALGVQITIK